MGGARHHRCLYCRFYCKIKNDRCLRTIRRADRALSRHDTFLPGRWINVEANPRRNGDTERHFFFFNLAFPREPLALPIASRLLFNTVNRRPNRKVERRCESQSHGNYARVLLALCVSGLYGLVTIVKRSSHTRPAGAHDANFILLFTDPKIRNYKLRIYIVYARM